MTYRKFPQLALSAIAVTAQTVTKPRFATQAMAEVVIGAGSGTSSVVLAGSNDGTNFTAIGSAVTSTNRAFALNADGQVYLYYRATTTIASDTKATQVTFYFN